MFDKEKELWQSVSAPASLHKKVEKMISAPVKKKKSVKVGTFSLIAASFALIVAALLFYKPTAKVEAYLDDGTRIAYMTPISDPNDNASLARTMFVEKATLFLELDGETEISTGYGEITCTTENGEEFFSDTGVLTVRENVKLDWAMPAPIDENYSYVLVKTGEREYVLQAALDDSGSLTLSFYENKK